MVFFQESIVWDNHDDVNDIMVRSVKEDGDCVIVFGCGNAGREATHLLEENGIEVEAYCEGRAYWKEGKTFLWKKVICVDDLDSIYSTATIILAATGAEMFHVIADLKQLGYKLYSFVNRCQLYEMSREWVKSHLEELSKTYNMLDDEESRLIFRSYIGMRSNCIKHDEMIPMLDLWRAEQYFNDLYPKSYFDRHVLVDCGAYIGDTAEQFLDFTKGFADEAEVYAFEMEDDNFKVLEQLSNNRKTIHCYHCGVGENRQTLYFEKNADASRIVDYPTDHRIEMVPVDDVLNEKNHNEYVSLVKMDLEGYEISALKGMRNLICRSHPMLAVCVYHRIDDLIRIPQLILKM